MGRYEYLALLAACVVLTLPLEFALHARVWRRPRRALRARLPVVVVFGVWDTVAIALGHWWFNPRSTTRVELPPGLPVEEIAWLSMVVIFVFMIPVDGWMSKVPNPIVIYDPDVLSGVLSDRHPARGVRLRLRHSHPRDRALGAGGPPISSRCGGSPYLS